MSQIAGMNFVVSAVGDANHFSIVWPGGGSNYTAFSGSPVGAFVRRFYILSYMLLEFRLLKRLPLALRLLL